MTDPNVPTDPPGQTPDATMGRRKFVKGALAAAAIGAVGVSGAWMAVPISTARLKVKRFPYWGARKVGGPAPQGIPLIPLKIAQDGVIEGVPSLEGAPISHNLDWYKYCSREKAPGLEAGFTNDNKLRYFNNAAKVLAAEKQLGQKLWYADKLEQEINANDFPAVGDGAPFRWRSEGQADTNIITGIVIRIDPAKMSGEGAGPFTAEFQGKHFIAFCSFCAHFCCVPGYKESEIPLKKGLFEQIYCTCHDSVYDPYQIKKYTYPPDF